VLFLRLLLDSFNISLSLLLFWCLLLIEGRVSLRYNLLGLLGRLRLRLGPRGLLLSILLRGGLLFMNLCLSALMPSLEVLLTSPAFSEVFCVVVVFLYGVPFLNSTE